MRTKCLIFGSGAAESPISHLGRTPCKIPTATIPPPHHATTATCNKFCFKLLVERRDQ